MQPQQTPSTSTPSVGKPMQTPTPHKVNRERLGSIVSTILIVIAAPAIALMINAFVFQSYEVDGSSMEPTLQNTNRLIINKVPKTWASIRGKDYLPGRHDIIVFHKPNNEAEQLIKRVIGLPGERVVVKDGKITVYNTTNPEGFNPDVGEYAEKLSPTDGEVDVTVKEGEVFVCGDNRIPGASLDSRSALGNVPLDLIVGKLTLRLLPLSELQTY